MVLCALVIAWAPGALADRELRLRDVVPGMLPPSKWLRCHFLEGGGLQAGENSLTFTKGRGVRILSRGSDAFRAFSASSAFARCVETIAPRRRHVEATVDYGASLEVPLALRPVDRDDTAAANRAVDACKGGDAIACRFAGAMVLGVAGAWSAAHPDTQQEFDVVDLAAADPAMRARAFELFEAGCTLGDARSCLHAAARGVALAGPGRGSALDAFRIVADKLCRDGLHEACTASLVARRVPRAHIEKVCAVGSALACAIAWAGAQLVAEVERGLPAPCGDPATEHRAREACAEAFHFDAREFRGDEAIRRRAELMTQELACRQQVRAQVGRAPEVQRACFEARDPNERVEDCLARECRPLIESAVPPSMRSDDGERFGARARRDCVDNGADVSCILAVDEESEDDQLQIADLWMQGCKAGSLVACDKFGMLVNVWAAGLLHDRKDTQADRAFQGTAPRADLPRDVKTVVEGELCLRMVEERGHARRSPVALALATCARLERQSGLGFAGFWTAVFRARSNENNGHLPRGWMERWRAEARERLETDLREGRGRVETRPDGQTR